MKEKPHTALPIALVFCPAFQLSLFSLIFLICSYLYLHMKADLKHLKERSHGDRRLWLRWCLWWKFGGRCCGWPWCFCSWVTVGLLLCSCLGWRWLNNGFWCGGLVVPPVVGGGVVEIERHSETMTKIR